MRPPVATVFLTEFDRPGRPGSWRELRRALCSWQASGRACLEVAGMPVDVVSIATAETPDDLPRPFGEAAARPFAIVVFDPQLAGSLIRLAAAVAFERDGPPPDDGPPIGSQP